jgi:putative FmdB family regulatory protein
MPTYVYHCDTCDSNFEKFQKFSEAPLTVCPEGHEGKVRRVITPSAIIFKGSGWYITDSKAGSSGGSTTSASKPTDGNGAATAESKSESKSGGDSSGEAKSDSKSESKEAKSESKSEGKSPSSTEAA